MENGFVILGIIALFFLSMYLYSYYSVVLEKLKGRKNRVKEMQDEEAFQQEKLAKQEIRTEKFRHLKERSAQIKLELARLAKKNESRLDDNQSHQVA